MLVFPTTVNPFYPYKVEGEFKTYATDFESGKEQRRQVWTFSKRTISLQYGTLKQSEMDELWNFYLARRGAFDSFWFFSPVSVNAQGEYVGRGDASTIIFELPSKNTDSDSLVVYVGGTQTAVTFLSGGGDAGVDRIQFSGPPANGNIITANFTGQQRHKARFKEDKMSKEMFSAALYSTGIDLREAL